MGGDRSSEAGEPVLVSDPRLVAQIEAENTLRQFDMAMSELNSWLTSPDYKLKPSKIMQLNRVALQKLSGYAGIFRPSEISITGSDHVPPDSALVPELMEELCEYINDNWRLKSASYLAAYALWKINWIHPFVDGNGRTARVISYIIMCAKLGYRLPGTKTIPDQIALDKKPYYSALEAADETFVRGALDLADLEELINNHLAVQLLEIHNAATGKNNSDRHAVASLPNNTTPTSARQTLRENFSIVRHVEGYPVIYGFVGASILGFIFYVVS